MDPRVKPEDDNLKWLFLFVIPAGLKRESISLMSISTFEHFNFLTNEPKLIDNTLFSLCLCASVVNKLPFLDLICRINKVPIILKGCII